MRIIALAGAFVAILPAVIPALASFAQRLLIMHAGRRRFSSGAVVSASEQQEHVMHAMSSMNSPLKNLIIVRRCGHRHDQKVLLRVFDIRHKERHVVLSDLAIYFLFLGPLRAPATTDHQTTGEYILD